MYNCALILAAGQGTRIKSDLPKVLHKVCGKEMVNHVIDTLRKAEINDINLIIGKGADLVKIKTENREVSYSLQDEQLGTGHAVKCAIDFLKDKEGTVAVLCGDAPLITEETIKRLFEEHSLNNNKATLLSSILDDASGYGRIIRNGDEVLKIVEHKDCNEEELKVREMNAGVYCFDIVSLLEALEKLSNNNSQGEYYLTDVIGILKEQGETEEDILEILRSKSRDNSRTPIQWNSKENAGFTVGTPWIPVSKMYKEINAEKALENKDSVFYHYKKLISLRKEYDVISKGNIEMILEEHNKVLAYTRNYENKTLVVLNNFYGEETMVKLPSELLCNEYKVNTLISNYSNSRKLKEEIILRPYESIVYYIEK